MQLLQCINLICPNFCFLWIVKKNFRPVSHTSLDLYKSIFLTEIYIHAIFLHLSNSNWSNSRKIPGFIFGLQQEIRTGSDGTEKIPFFEALKFFCWKQARGGGGKALVAGPIKKTQIFFAASLTEVPWQHLARQLSVKTKANFYVIKQIYVG